MDADCNSKLKILQYSDRVPRISILMGNEPFELYSSSGSGSANSFRRQRFLLQASSVHQGYPITSGFDLAEGAIAHFGVLLEHRYDSRL